MDCCDPLSLPGDLHHGARIIQLPIKEFDTLINAPYTKFMFHKGDYEFLIKKFLVLTGLKSFYQDHRKHRYRREKH